MGVYLFRTFDTLSSGFSGDFRGRGFVFSLWSLAWKLSMVIYCSILSLSPVYVPHVLTDIFNFLPYVKIAVRMFKFWGEFSSRLDWFVSNLTITKGGKDGSAPDQSLSLQKIFITGCRFAWTICIGSSYSDRVSLLLFGVREPGHDWQVSIWTHDHLTCNKTAP